MLYSDFIKTDEKINSALKAAGVSDTPSIVKEDFHIPSEFIEPLRERFTDFEILTRRQTIQHEVEMKELKEARLEQEKKHPDWKAFKEWEKNQPSKEKIDHILPHIKKLIQGNLQEPFDETESGCIQVVAEYCARHFDYVPGENESTQEDYSGLNELQKLLKKSGVTRLSNKMSIEEIALRGLHQSSISKFLK